MKGTWGRRVYGRVTKGTKTTRFYLEITLRNGCVFFENQLVSNEDLKNQPLMYRWTLDMMTERLMKRVAERAQ